MTERDLDAIKTCGDYVKFLFCLKHRYTFFMRAIPNGSENLIPLEKSIKEQWLLME